MQIRNLHGHLKRVTSYQEFLQTYFAQATIRCDKSIGSAHKEIKLAAQS